MFREQVWRFRGEDSKMFAKEDFEEGGPPISSCYGCGKPILDRFLLTVLDKERRPVKMSNIFYI